MYKFLSYSNHLEFKYKLKVGIIRLKKAKLFLFVYSSDEEYLSADTLLLRLIY